MAMHGQVTLGTFLAFASYVANLVGPARMLASLIVNVQLARAGVERVYELIDSNPTVTDAPDAVDVPDGPLEVRLDGVRFGYTRSEPVLDGVSLAVRPGETLALVGTAGSGKSTVSLLLPRFYDVHEGAITVAGVDIRELRLASLRRAVGVVFEEAFLFSDTVRANIAYGRPDATDEEVRAAARAAQADEFIAALPDGYDTVVGERGLTLSGGQRQRRRARPGAAVRPAGAGARRRDLRRGHRDRGGHPRHAARGHPRPHHAADRAPPVHARARRPDRRARPRPGRRRRHPRGADRPLRAVPGAAGRPRRGHRGRRPGSSPPISSPAPTASRPRCGPRTSRRRTPAPRGSRRSRSARRAAGAAAAAWRRWRRRWWWHERRAQRRPADPGAAGAGHGPATGHRGAPARRRGPDRARSGLPAARAVAARALDDGAGRVAGHPGRGAGDGAAVADPRWASTAAWPPATRPRCGSSRRSPR